jgi:hypothetical protein
MQPRIGGSADTGSLRVAMMQIEVIDASDLLGESQLAGVVVSPVGLFRRLESSVTVGAGVVVVPGSTGPAIAGKLGGTSASELRRADAEASVATPDCGQWGFLAVSERQLALTSTQPPKLVGRRLGEIVEHVARSTITAVELESGWRHFGVYLFSSAPLRITFADGTTWTFEVARFYRRHAKRVVGALQ